MKALFNTTSLILKGINCDINHIEGPHSYFNISMTEYAITGCQLIIGNNQEVTYIQNSKKPYAFSGNNGYIKGLPLKIAYQANNNYITFPYGFIPVGRNANGECIEGEISDPLDEDKPILFGEDFSYSCKLHAYDCDENVLSNLVLKKIIDQILLIGRFGSSDIYFNKNWTVVKNLANNTTKFDFNKTENDTCEYFSNFVFKVFVGEIGYQTSPQLYVTFAKYEMIPQQIKVNSSYDFDFNLKVEYIYFKKDLLSHRMDIPAFLPRLPKDLIDPFIEIDYNS